MAVVQGEGGEGGLVLIQPPNTSVSGPILSEGVTAGKTRDI